MYKLPARQITTLFHTGFIFHISEPQLYYSLYSLLPSEFLEFLGF